MKRLLGLEPGLTYPIGDNGTHAQRHSFGDMDYTDRDLVLAERDVSALESFIAEQQERISHFQLLPEQRRQFDDLREQLVELLEVQRSRYWKIWTALHTPR